MGSAQTPITGETAPSEPPRLPRPALALFDLDGTLLHETHWLPGARDILDTLTAAGVPIAFCSGRTLASLKLLVADLPHIAHLAGNGGTLIEKRDADGWRPLARHGLDADTVAATLAWTTGHGLETWMFTRTEWIVSQESDTVVWDASVTGSRYRVGGLDQVTDVVKMAVVPHDEAQRALAYELPIPGVEVARAHPRILDLVPTSALRFKGAEAIVADLGVDWADVWAAGDGQNDLGMLGATGVSFLMPPLRVGDLSPAGRARGVRIEADNLAGVMTHVERALAV